MNPSMKKFGASLVFFLAVIFSSSSIQAEDILKSRIVRDNYTYSTSSLPQLTNFNIGWNSSVTVPNGKIQVLFYAFNNAGLSFTNDGSSDANAFDWGGLGNEATALCPNDVPGEFEFAPAQSESAAVASFEYDGNYYHVVTCAYTGAGSADIDFGYNGNNNFLTVNGVINPRFDAGVSNGDLVYTPVLVRQLNSDGDLVNDSLQTLTSSRNVQMLAQISPILTLELDGINAGVTACGNTNQRSTAGNLANFGVVDELNFTDIVQKLSVTTNARNGYVLTAIANDQMKKNGNPLCGSGGVGDSLCIPNAQVAGMTTTVAQAWSGTNEYGLGYTLENLISDDPSTNGDAVFAFTTGYRHFADTQEGESPVPILQTTTGKESENYVCYRLKSTPTNQPGIYTNEITYTLTANF
jgi:hypothetical protein